MTINTGRSRFGALRIHAGEIIDAPPICPIPLHTLNRPGIVVDSRGILICGTIRYTPIDLDPAGLTLICRREDPPP
jgi:hypothetical protein